MKKPVIKRELPRELKKWLMKKHILDSFLKNVNATSKYHIKSFRQALYTGLTGSYPSSYYNIISAAFVWDHTSEGASYWYLVYNQWRRHIQEVMRQREMRRLLI